MLYSMPTSINPLTGPRTFGFIPKRRGLGSLTATSWQMTTLTQRGAPPIDNLSFGTLSIPLSSLGVTKAWRIDAGSSNASIVSLTGPDGTRKTFSFQVTGGTHGQPQKLSLVDTQTQNPPMAVPAGFTKLGNTPQMQGWLKSLTGLNDTQNYAVVPQHPAGDLWAYKTDITFADPNTPFIGKRTTFLDLSTGETFVHDWQESSGGGAPTIISKATKAVAEGLAPISAPLVQALTIAGTGGVSEAVGLVDDNAKRQVEAVVGGSSIGGATGAVTGAIAGTYGGPAGIVVGAIAGAVAGAVAGTVEGISVAASDRESKEVVGGAVVSGGIAGLIAGIGTDVYAASGAVPPPVGQGPVTLTPDTAGSTLLPSHLSLVSSAPAPPVFSLPPVIAPISADFAAPPIDHLPLPPAPQDYAGSTLLPPKLSLIESPPAGYYGFNPVLPIPFAQPAPPTPGFSYSPGIDNAGSTLLPPDLSAVPPVDIGVVSPPGTPSLLTDILNAGKVAVPGALSGYQIYKKLTTPDAGSGASAGDVSFYGDPYANQTPPAPAAKPSYAGPLLAGGALLLLLASKAKRHYA